MLGGSAMHMPYLRRLDFSRNQLFHENAEELATALVKHKKLTYLDLTSVGLAD